jgi:ribonuclease P protein component
VLPKKNRLSDQDFAVVKKEGKKVIGPLFGLLIKRDGGNETRFGFIVSKKIDKRATVRNKIKRQLDQALFPFLSQIKPGVKVVFLARRSLINQAFTRIRSEMVRMLKKGGLLPD